MKKNTYIIGNWKSNMVLSEIKEWFFRFSDLSKGTAIPEWLNIILCVPSIYLPATRELVEWHKLSIQLAAQNVSPFSEGAYTGEVTARQIREFARYVLIGHSERRTLFQETNEHIRQKVSQAHDHDLSPILCVSDSSMEIPPGVSIVAYEPIGSIGTGKAETPELADSVAQEIMNKSKTPSIIYGGSVSGENARKFLEQPHIYGVLPGKASLDARSFWDIIFHVL